MICFTSMLLMVLLIAIVLGFVWLVKKHPLAAYLLVVLVAVLIVVACNS